MIIRNTKTGETKNVDPSQLPSYGLSAPKMTPTSTPQPQQPTDNQPGSNPLESLMKMFFPQSTGAVQEMQSPNYNNHSLQESKSATGNIGNAAKMAFGDTMNTMGNIGKMGLEAASYNPFLVEAKAAPLARMGVNAVVGGATDAMNKGSDAGSVALSALLSSILPEGVRGGLTGVNKVVRLPEILNEATAKEAGKTSTLFPVEELYKLLEEKASQVTAKGDIGDMAKVLNTMKNEAGVSKEGSGLVYSGDIMNNERKLFNKAYQGKDNNIKDKAQTLMANILKEAQIKDNPEIAGKLGAQELSINIGKLLDKFPAIGSFTKEALGLGGKYIGKASNPTGGLGELLQNLTRIGAQNSGSTYRNVLSQ